ncbi:MAG TPA: replicative DNA helicase, partial [Armatimonadetes bacterium]|nr:replicative DNA helicase [Armatimonadota bacterium]
MAATNLDRVMPHSVEAEQAVLGAMLVDTDAVAQVVEMLKPEDFYYEPHRRIYEVILRLFNRGDSVDLITVIAELRRDGALEQVGGAYYMGTLMESCPSVANVTDYARIVEEKAILRNLIAAATQIASWAYEQPDDIESVIDRAEATIFAVGQRRVGAYFEPLPHLLKQTYAKIDYQYHHRGLPTGVPTGFAEFDSYTSGLQPSDLIVIAGRPGMGKTAFALTIAQHVALNERQVVAIFSLEMSKEQLVQRMLCSRAMVDSHRLRSGYLREEDWEKIAKAFQDLYDAPIFIDDTPNLSPFEIRAKARRLRAEHGLGLIIIDYLQLVRPPRRAENRVQEVAEIARSLKNLARELNVPVLVLSQLSRAVEHRESKRPLLADLRDSGAI